MNSSKDKLKIVLCANSCWCIYNFRRSHIKAYKEIGHEVFVVAPKDDYSDDLIRLGVNICSFTINPKGVNPFQELITFLKILKIYFIIKPDYIMNFTPKMNIYSSFAGFLCRAKIINNITGLGIVFSERTRFKSFVMLLYKFSQLFATKVFFQNQFDMQYFNRKKIVSPKKSDLLPGSGVDLNHFSPVEAKNDDIVRFIIICRMLYSKGLTLYADAASLLKDKYGKSVEFIAVGFIEDDKESIPRSLMTEWQDSGQIIFKGALKDIRPELANSDCIVLPSFYPEGMPRSLLEAAAMGKPIITTNTPGCSATVDDEKNGFLCEPKSLDNLIEKLEKMIAIGHNGRIDMGRLSRNKALKEFDEKIVINKYLQCLES
jgi:glycosyltransferase involved in cell wall biosynthesis